MLSRYRAPTKLGQDRLVNAYAASQIYDTPVIVASFGTAITFDIVSRKKEHLGGMILPGLNTALEVLHRKTAQLPKIKLEAPGEFIGRNTKEGILSGIVCGFASLCDELTRRIRKRVGKNARLIVSGGDARLIAKYSNQIKKIDRELTLKGLNLIYRLSRKKSQKNS
jgi:type III pantothenate kinase